jgi:hypothetical protein
MRRGRGGIDIAGVSGVDVGLDSVGQMRQMAIIRGVLGRQRQFLALPWLCRGH